MSHSDVIGGVELEKICLTGLKFCSQSIGVPRFLTSQHESFQKVGEMYTQTKTSFNVSDKSKILQQKGSCDEAIH